VAARGERARVHAEETWRSKWEKREYGRNDEIGEMGYGERERGRKTNGGIKWAN
jgi:hypothetical protein